MSIAGENGTCQRPEKTGKILERSWGDLSGRRGDRIEENPYQEAFQDVRFLLNDAEDYLLWENMELPKNQILDKFDELEPEESEYLEAELTSYSAEDGAFNVLEVKKGDIEDVRIASTGYSFKPTVTTDKLPTEEYEKVVSVNKSNSNSYRIMWEE